MARKVKLSTGRVFKTIKEAKAYFSSILKENELSQPFKGEVLQEINAAYLAYCDVTNWQLKSPPVDYYPMNNKNPGYTTRCYGVTYEDGSTDSFSMLKALSEIAV